MCTYTYMSKNNSAALSNSDAAANVPPPHEVSIESPPGGTSHEIEDADTTVSIFLSFFLLFFHLV